MLKGSNLILRPIQEDDIYILNEWKNDYTIFKYLGGGYRPTSIVNQKEWLHNMANITENNQRFIIEYKGEKVGLVGLYNINVINKNSEIGIYIGEKNQQHQGVGNQTLKLIEDYANLVLGIKKLKLYVVGSNEVATHFWEKNNYRIVGRLHKERYVEGVFEDVYIMEKFLTNKEY